MSKRTKVTPRQLDVLGIVDAVGPVTASDVGRHLPIGAAAARAALSALEWKCLVGASYTTGARGRAYVITGRGAEILAAAWGD